MKILKWRPRGSCVLGAYTIVYACGLLVLAAQITRWQNLRAQIAACARHSRPPSSRVALDLGKCNACDLSKCNACDPSSCSEHKKRGGNVRLHRAGEWGLDQLIKIHPAFGDEKCWQYSSQQGRQNSPPDCVHNSPPDCGHDSSRDRQKFSGAATKAFPEMSCSVFLTFEQMLRVLQLVEHPAFKERLNLSKLVLEPDGSADSICNVTLALVKRKAK